MNTSQLYLTDKDMVVRLTGRIAKNNAGSIVKMEVKFDEVEDRNIWVKPEQLSIIEDLS